MFCTFGIAVVDSEGRGLRSPFHSKLQYKISIFIFTISHKSSISLNPISGIWVDNVSRILFRLKQVFSTSYWLQFVCLGDTYHFTCIRLLLYKIVVCSKLVTLCSFSFVLHFLLFWYQYFPSSESQMVIMNYFLLYNPLIMKSLIFQISNSYLKNIRYQNI